MFKMFIHRHDLVVLNSTTEKRDKKNMEKAGSLEITVISAEELRIGNRPIKNNAFVTVQTDPQSFRSTVVDRDGGSYPSWNQRFQLALPASARSINVQVQCKTVTGVRTVGSANVPVSDIVDSYVPPHQIHFLSYRLRERDGRRNGIINLSVKMVGPEPAQVGQKWVSAQQRRLCDFGRNGVAVGIPVAKCQ